MSPETCYAFGLGMIVGGVIACLLFRAALEESEDEFCPCGRRLEGGTCPEMWRTNKP